MYLIIVCSNIDIFIKIKQIKIIINKKYNINKELNEANKASARLRG